MNILAIETCTGACSVSVLSGGEILATNVEKDSSTQAEKLLPIIEKTMKRAGLDYTGLDLLAATIGPGSFTGVRIGLAAIQGIQIVTGLDFIGISTLEATAWKFLSAAKLSKKIKFVDVLINANRGQAYYQRFSANKTLTARIRPELVDVGSIGKKSGAVAVCSLGLTLGKKISFTASDVAELAAFRYSQGRSSENPTPLYIRPPDAKLPKKSA